ncbi:MAG: ComEA family DNA-binding protein [Planctomycetota bacterium]|jgi:competence ComEA-like helix-hairpin-helix protein
MRQAKQNKIQSFAFVISVCMAFCFCWAFASNPVRSESAFIGRKFELESRINPNEASVESLVRLPGLGIGRAGVIVAYRENSNEKNSDSPVFQNWDDLQKVKGIGPKTVQSISQWLKFD